MSIAKKVVLLGSTGSIGTSALKVARDIPERMEIVGLAANRSVGPLVDQVRATGVNHIALWSEEAAEEASSLLGSNVSVMAGEEGLVELACLPEADMVI
ncbi:MAG: 1-deoxy-D-xylulose-5-phosphate reductoisomerase, partial [Verrucomicrobiales bacterium]